MVDAQIDWRLEWKWMKKKKENKVNIVKGDLGMYVTVLLL